MNMGTSRAMALAAVVLGGAVFACTDTVIEPKSTVTEANIFTDPNSYKAFIAKVYGGLAVTGQQGPTNQPDIGGLDEGFAEYVRVWWQLNELPTDEAVVAWGDPGLPEINSQQWASSNVWVYAMWSRIYFQVGMANEFLRQSTDAKLASRNQNDPALITAVHYYRAEARFLRALSYWHLIDMFGNGPLATEADPLGGSPPPPVARDSIYRFVVSELTAILPDLPAPSAATYGRATPWAAQMLLAHVYLNAAVYTGTPAYDKARTAAEAVINSGVYSLAPAYRNNFLADNNTSPEIIFAVPFDGQHTQTWGGTTFLVHASCGGAMNNANYGVNGCWWGLRMKLETYQRYQTPTDSAGDGRAAFFFIPDSALVHGDTTDTNDVKNGTAPTTGIIRQTDTVFSISNFHNGIPAPKYSNLTSGGSPGLDGTFPDTDFPMFRLADAYLIYAECVLRGGGGSTGQALTYVNQLRDRAFGNTSGDVTSGDLTLQFVLDERSRELLWEGHRRSDLIRYGQYTGGTYLWSWKGGTRGGVATDAHLNLYPIPLNELAANPNMKQNPGY